jgi:5-methylcytosine-specific restriction endonuclease McrA
MHKMRLRIHGSLDLPDVHCAGCGDGPLKRKPGYGLPPKWCPACLRQRVRDNSSIQHHIRRTLYASGDKITITELGERDGWRCHLCGKKVRKRTGKDRRMGPSIDHLIPVSAEGAHVWENVALAHFGCNSKRNNRGAAQLRLIA